MTDGDKGQEQGGEENDPPLQSGTGSQGQVREGGGHSFPPPSTFKYISLINMYDLIL